MRLELKKLWFGIGGIFKHLEIFGVDWNFLNFFCYFFACGWVTVNFWFMFKRFLCSIFVGERINKFKTLKFGIFMLKFNLMSRVLKWRTKKIWKYFTEFLWILKIFDSKISPTSFKSRFLLNKRPVSFLKFCYFDFFGFFATIFAKFWMFQNLKSKFFLFDSIFY